MDQPLLWSITAHQALTSQNGALRIFEIIHVESACKYDIVATTQNTPDTIIGHWNCARCGKTDDITYEVTSCFTCNARGGTISGEMQGDGYMTGYVEFFEPCDDCLSIGCCPGCSNPTLTEGVFEAAMDDVSTFICPICGWQFDRGRFYDEYDYEPDYGDEHKLDGYGDDLTPDGYNNAEDYLGEL